MKKYITLLCLAGTVLLQQEHTYAQPDCKLQLNLDSGQCYLPATVRANTDYGIYQIEWYKDGNLLHSYTREWDTTGAGVVVAGGNGPGDQLNQLMARGLEADEHDTLFIGDNRLNAVPKTNRVFKWYPGNATGTVVADGLNAPAASQCKPGDISLDQNKDLFIADEDNHRIIKWTPGATSGTNYAGTPGSTGSTLSQFNNINGIHYDTVSDNLYILDAFNFRLLEWPLNASSGNLLVSKLNSNPQYIDMDLEGNLYVSDFNNNRIIMFPPGSSTSVTVAGSPNGTGGNADSLLKAPEGVTVDGLKNLYISDYSNNRVQMWPFGSDKGITIGGGRGKGDALNQLNLPNSITQDRWGNVYVGDLNNHRVLMYAPLPIPDTLYTMEEGTYTVVVKTFSGCILTDSILVAPQVEHPEITINDQSELGTVGQYAKYQWILDDEPIPGATSSTYKVTANGLYRVAVENEQGCKDTSDVYKVNSVSIGSIATGGSILIYPNPANNMVHISGVEPAHITISTIEGRVIKTYNKTNRFSVEGLSSGAYLLKITDANNNVIHIEKLIKSE